MAERNYRLLKSGWGANGRVAMEPEDTTVERRDSTYERNQEILVELTDVIGKKWHPVILHQLLTEGELGFGALRSRVPGITNKMLSQGLQALEDDGLVERRVLDTQPVRVRYSLTNRGEEMGDVVRAMLRWGRRHLDEEETSDRAAATRSAVGGDCRSVNETTGAGHEAVERGR